MRHERGFGFIHQDGTDGRDGLFFHRYDLAEELDFDELLIERRVVFDIEQTLKGPRAVRIRAAT
jgi:cold shock CspA family protein